jgi:hypothetical protein
VVSLGPIDSGGGNEYSRDPLMVLAVLTLAGVPRDTHGRYFRSVLVGFGNFERPWSYFREGQESDVTGSTIHEGRWTGPTYLYSDLRVPT